MTVNVLLSYALHADTKLDRVRRNLVCGNLLIDSGAFTAHTKGRPIDIGAYASYLERWRGCWDHAITLDVIGDPVATRRNTAVLHRRGLPVMPVFTRGDRVAEFDAMVRDCGYVCVGGLVGMPKKWQIPRVTLLQKRAEQLGGGIHALGIGSMDTLRQARPYSADASSISGAFRFGSVVYFDGTTVRSTPVTDRAKLARDLPHLRSHGIDVGLIARTGRMPGKEGRDLLLQAMSLAYAAGDEYLKRTRPVPPPVRLPPGSTVPRPMENGTSLYSSIGAAECDVISAGKLSQRLHPGTHLYSSVAAGYARSASALDNVLHSSAIPPIWRQYGRTHTCTRRDATPDAS